MIVREPTQDVVCDFVDGFAFGDAIGVGLRSVSGWWTLNHVELADSSMEVGKSCRGCGVLIQPKQDAAPTLWQDIRIAPTQTRTIPIRLSQSLPFRLNEIQIHLTLTSGTRSIVMPVILPVRQVLRWTESDFIPIKSSYLYAQSMPTSYLVIPPIDVNVGEPRPPVVALRTCLLSTVVIECRSYSSQTVLGLMQLEISFGRNLSLVRSVAGSSFLLVEPLGYFYFLLIMSILKISYLCQGLDWHGPSAQDVWSSLDALVATLERNQLWHSWRLAKGTAAIVMGHSNGGQGSWYLGSRYPDRVIAGLEF